VPNRIARLTPEQLARMPEWVEKWTAVGLSTEPANFDRATVAALSCYDAAGLRRPRLVLHMGSPLAGLVGGVLGAIMIANKEGFCRVKWEGWERIRAEVWRWGWREIARRVDSRALSQIKSLLMNEVWRHSGRREIESQIMGQVVREVDSRAVGQVLSLVGSEVWGQVWNQLMSQVGGGVTRQVRSQVEIEVMSEVKSLVTWPGDQIVGATLVCCGLAFMPRLVSCAMFADGRILHSRASRMTRRWL